VRGLPIPLAWKGCFFVIGGNVAPVLTIGEIGVDCPIDVILPTKRGKVRACLPDKQGARDSERTGVAGNVRLSIHPTAADSSGLQSG